MARLLVQFPGEAGVLIDGERRGSTNRVLPVDAGEHVVSLEGEQTEPDSITLTIAPEDDVRTVVFQPVLDPIDRFSPLYCRYNGFLLGQFIVLSFASYARGDYAIRRARILEFLREIEVDVEIPEDPLELSGDEHVPLLEAVIQSVSAKSIELAEFVLLGAMFLHYPILTQTDPETAQDILDRMEHIREVYGLPELEPEKWADLDNIADVDAVLAPSLRYLTATIDLLEPERDTAFVIMPFKPPYAGYFSTFYRPALERSGFRAFRAWGGLSNEDYCDLLLRLISKCGLVWADVSELNPNVIYEIGAAHAFGKLSMLVVREEDSAAIPANIGHDTVVQYSPSSAEWPVDAVERMTVYIAALQLAAERGERLRVGSKMTGEVLDSIFARLEATIIPPEAHEAAKRGREQFEAQDFASAERSFHDAILLGLDEPLNRLGRGCSRVALERFDEAEPDLDSVIASDADPSLRSVAYFFRGQLREEQDRTSDAYDDYSTAIALGFDDPAVIEAQERCRGDAK
jgi:tetratricopeptide (TPR) repeat protein